MEIVESSPRRVLLIAVTAAAVMAAGALAVSTWAPWTPQASPSPHPSAHQSSQPSPSAVPSPTPLAGATDADPLPPCDPDLRPQSATPSPVAPPVAGPVALRLVGQLGGAAGTATLLGQDLFVGSGSQIVHVDLSDARTPREMTSSGPLPGSVEHVAAAGDLLAVAVGDGGMAILDPADRLALRSSLALPGYAEAIAVDGLVAFVADGPGGLRVVSLRNPARPVEVAELLDLHRIVDIVVEGSVAYVAAADEGLLVIDVSDPTAPRELGRLFTGGYAFGVAADGDRVLLADGWGGVRVIDVADPKAPRLITTVPTTAWAMGVQIDQGRAYVAAGNEFRVFDLADAGDPEGVGSLPLAGGHAAGVSVSGERAVVVDDTAGIRILDIGAGSPAELSTYAPLAPADGLEVIGNRAFIAAKGQGLQVVDISDPGRPSAAPGLRTQELVSGVVAVGSNLFFMTVPGPGSPWVGGIFGLDGSAPGPLVPEAPFGEGSGLATAVDGSTLFIAAERGVWIVDGRVPSPCEFAYLDTASQGFEANGISVADGFAYIAPFYEEIRVVDVSNPSAPILLDQTGESGGVGVAKTLAVGDRLFAIGADDEGPVAAVFDIGVPTAPKIMGSVRLPAATATADQNGPQMAYSGGHLFIADETGGLVVIDVSNPSRPGVAGRLRLPGVAIGVVVEGDHAYVASDGGGLFVVEWSAGTAASPSEADIDGAAGVVPPRHLEMRLAAMRPPEREPPSPLATPVSCLVTSTTYFGPGSLRECLAEAEAGAVITFDPGAFPADDPTTIELEGGGFTLPEGVTIDGSGAGVVVDGRGKVAACLHADSETLIRGLTVTGCAIGISVNGSDNTVADSVVSANGEMGIAVLGSNNRVVGNLIGLDPSGSRRWGSQRIGVFVSEGASRNIVGGPDPADRNVISGNASEVHLKGAQGTTIQGNYIGTDAPGAVVLGSDEGRGITVEVGSAGNRVVDNVVARSIGVIDPGSSYNAIVGNLVGVDASGSRALESAGVIVIDEAFNQVGGTLPGEGNIINGGIAIQTTDTVVLGNRLGVGEDGNPLDGEGGSIVAVKPGAIIGGRSAGATNLVVGGAIELRSDSNVLIGNRLGLRELEDDVGIWIASAGRNHVIANFIETKAGVGIHLSEDAYGNVIRGNVVRGNWLGLLADPSSERNLITGNAFDGNGTQAHDVGVVNLFDDGTRGNYWSDLDGPDADGDGVVDRFRAIGPEGVDRFPLAQPP